MKPTLQTVQMKNVLFLLRPKPWPRGAYQQSHHILVSRRFKKGLASSNPLQIRLHLLRTCWGPPQFLRFTSGMFYPARLILRKLSPRKSLTTTRWRTSLSEVQCRWLSERGCLRGKRPGPITTQSRTSLFLTLANLCQIITLWQTTPQTQTMNLLQ